LYSKHPEHLPFDFSKKTNIAENKIYYYCLLNNKKKNGTAKVSQSLVSEALSN
jgi:hypothetical protein